MRHIALDGPSNGLYIDPEQAAANSYDSLIVWDEQTGEKAWLHATSTDDIPAEFVNDGEDYS